MQPLTVHWSQVSTAAELKFLGEGQSLFALWPSPVNHDACFEKAGFTDFGDSDEVWDAHADALLTRLLTELSGFGPPRLLSQPLV